MATKKLKKKVKRRAAPLAEKSESTSAPQWSFVSFGDLHVRAGTFDRALRTLAFIREQTVARSALIPRPSVLCLGDFWDQRGVLSVRHVHDLCDEFDRWEKEHIHMRMIPGNHDQVDRDGMVHGLRIFHQYSNIQVITEPWTSHDEQCVFIPWRDDPVVQREAFASVPDGYTVFGHAEAPGAQANNGHKMDGRFELLPGPRAIYLAHFHKRQSLVASDGTPTTYLGSPFEQNFGERDTPHGIAVINSDSVDPEFIDVPDMPKHYVFTYPHDVKKFREPLPQDIVQVHADVDLFNSDEFEEAVSLITADDVRPIPYSEPEEGMETESALTLDSAIEAYTEEYECELNIQPDVLAKFGRDVLAQIPDAGRIVPMGPLVRITHARVTGFCKIKDTVDVPLSKQGTVLLRGKMGVGKTSLCDGITWGLTGRTTPRKPGEAGAQLKADQVINDDCKHCVVDVYLEVRGETYCVQRTKARGKGAVVRVFKKSEDGELVDIGSGVSDAQYQIHSLIGMDYDLWRTCVYLGQGAVANFVTDADKARKGLLNRAFGLGVCPHALKIVKATRQPVREAIDELERRIERDIAVIDAKRAINFDAESVRWETDRQGALQAARDEIEQHKKQVEEWDLHLQGEAQWTDVKKRTEAEVEGLTNQLTKSDTSDRRAELVGKMGGLRAELSHIARELDQTKASYSKSQSTSSGVCGECGQSLPQEQWEGYLSDLESRIEGKQAEQKTRQTQLSQMTIDLGELTVEGSSNSGQVKSQIDEARGRLAKADQALNAIAVIKSRRETAVAQWERLRNQIKTRQAEANPFEAKKRERDVEVLKLEGTVDELQSDLAERQLQKAVMDYWEVGFGPKGLPVLVLRTALTELEMYANRFLGELLSGSVRIALEMEGDDLNIRYYESKKGNGEWRERSYTQLSGGQRRCAELSFVPFALSEMIFNRIGLRIPLLIIDELTTHMDPDTKPLVCALLQHLNRETTLVIDHDVGVQGSFDTVWEVSDGGRIQT